MVLALFLTAGPAISPTDARQAGPAEPAYAGKTRSEWVALLSSGDPFEQAVAIEVIVCMGPDAGPVVPVLLKAAARRQSPLNELRLPLGLTQQMRTHDTVLLPSVFDSVIRGLGEAAVPELVNGLGSPNPLIQEKATKGVALLGPRAKKALTGLIKLLGEKEPEVSLYAIAQALESIGPDAAVALPAVTRFLKDPDSALRLAVAGHMLKIDPTWEAAQQVLVGHVLSELIHKVPNPGPEERKALFNHELLKNLKPAPQVYVRELRKILKTAENDRVIGAAAHRLGELRGGAREALPDLIAALKRAGRSAASIVVSIGVLGPDAAPAAPMLCDLLATPPKELQNFERANLRGYIIGALAAIGPAAKDRAAPLLRPALQADKDWSERHETALAFMAFDPDDRGTLAILIDCYLKNPGAPVSVARSYKRLTQCSKAQVPILREALETAKERRQRIDLTTILLAIEPTNQEMIDLLVTEARKTINGYPAAPECTGSLVRNGISATPALLEMLKYPETRRAALDALYGLQPEPGRAIDDLAKLLKPTVPELAKLLKTDGNYEKLAIARLLQRFASVADGALPALTEALQDRWLDLRLAAVDTILAIDPGHKAVAPALVATLQRMREDRVQATDQDKKVMNHLVFFRPFAGKVLTVLIRLDPELALKNGDVLK